MQLTTRLRRVLRLWMSGAVRLFFRMPTWCVDLWPLPLPSWVPVMMRKGFGKGVRLECSELYHAISLENLENQGNKLRIVCLRGRFWTQDLTKTKQGWHHVDRNERWTAVQNISWDMQCCLVSSAWRCLLMNAVFMTGVCFAVGLDWFPESFVTLREKMKLSVNFRLMCWWGNLCDKHVTWVGLLLVLTVILWQCSLWQPSTGTVVVRTDPL